MTAILDADGKLVLSDDVCQKGGLEQGARFDVLVSSEGDIILKRERKHRMTLVEHMRGLEGLEIRRNREPVGDPIDL